MSDNNAQEEAKAQRRLARKARKIAAQAVVLPAEPEFRPLYETSISIGQLFDRAQVHNGRFYFHATRLKAHIESAESKARKSKRKSHDAASKVSPVVPPSGMEILAKLAQSIGSLTEEVKALKGDAGGPSTGSSKKRKRSRQEPKDDEDEDKQDLR